MNKRKPLKAQIFLLLAVALCLPVLPATSQNRSQEVTLENIGKENPFEVVRPIVETKKKLMSKMLRPGEYASAQQQIVEIIPDMYIKMVMLKFLRAESIEPVASNLLSAYGKISIDSATNSIIICDTPEKLQMIIAEINKIDKTPQQVMIEVVIVDVKLEDNTEIGVDWAHPGGKGNIFTQELTSITDGMDFTFLHNGIDISVKALQQVRDVEILASPKVMVLSGETALIQTIEEIPYTELSDSTQGAAGLTSTEFKEVGVTLEVSVLITDEQRIKLTVSPEQSVNTGRIVQGALDNTIPVIDIRRLTTTLLMEDGQVAVLGGLRRRNRKNSVDKIPLLGDLPLIGFLFSNDKIEVEHTELVVFISPHIYKGESLTEGETKQFNELRNSPAPKFQEHKRPEFEFIKDVFGVINEAANIYP